MSDTRLFGIEDVAGSDDWYTPQWIFDGLELVFSLDVAAPTGGVPWIPSEDWFDESDDGTSQRWVGTVWCNPPYSDPSAFAVRMVEHDDGCLLIRADLSTAWAFHAFSHAQSIWVPKGRLSFESYQGGVKGGSSFSSVMLGYGAAACDAMERLGDVNGATRTLQGR